MPQGAVWGMGAVEEAFIAHYFYDSCGERSSGLNLGRLVLVLGWESWQPCYFIHQCLPTIDYSITPSLSEQRIVCVDRA